jgi:hypothetical protein
MLNRPILIVFILTLLATPALALEQTVTVPAESPEGTTLDLPPGDYQVELTGGGITLFYPINPQYQWLFGVSIGTGERGGLAEPSIGTLYFEPYPRVYSQAAAETQLLEAREKNLDGTFLTFTLAEATKVRFWVSDFDYTDNSGMIKLKIGNSGDTNSNTNSGDTMSYPGFDGHLN